MIWNQRSRVLWLKEGDRNTKFFHAMASQRQRKNKSEGIMDSYRDWHDSKEATEGIILNYFESIFSSDHLESFAESVGAVEKRISVDMNKELLKEFRSEEVWTTLNQMHPTKSPCPDGLSPIFYQKYWDIVGPSVSHCVLQALNSGIMLERINETYICLIPKTKNPQQVTEYHPISLCNVVYKLMAKVLANRLKKVLPVVIGEVQSAFVLGRLITDNVLLASEMMHSIDQRRKGKEGLMAIKLDMSKAYDRAKWGYLEAMMRKMGFHERWIAPVMRCVHGDLFSSY